MTSIQNLDQSQAKKLILVDADDTILSWDSAFTKFTKTKYPEVQVSRKKADQNIEKQLFENIVRDFNDSEEFEFIKPYRDAKIYLPKIAQMGYKFVVISTCMGSIDTKIRREKNIHKVFGEDLFHSIECLPLWTSKETILGDFKPTFFIDDKEEHCLSGRKAGHTTFQMGRKLSKTEVPKNNIIPVRTWCEVYTSISLINQINSVSLLSVQS